MSEPHDEAEIPLLPLQASLLDASVVDQLFFDIEHAAELLQVQVKSRPGTYVEASSPTLAEARQLLMSGSVLGVQLRYRAKSKVWCDTLLRTAEGIRIVRAPDLSR